MRHYLTNRPSGKVKAHVVLAHGAGAPMDSPFMEIIAEGIAAYGILVTRFEFPYMAKRRTGGKGGGPGSPKVLLQTWRNVIRESAGDLPLFIGGKSMGGRIASMVADEPGLTGIICLGYPFHPPGSPDKLRTGHLKTMPLPTLIIQGERDPFGTRDEVGGYGLAGTVECVWIPDGDHSLKPRKKSGHDERGNLALAIDAANKFVEQEIEAGD